MRRSKSGIRYLCTAALVVGIAGAVSAKERPPYTTGALRKLGRGVANLATCPLELVRMTTLVGRRDGNLAALSVGLIQGTWRTALRGLAGAYEVTTFVIPLPRGFKPVMTPEFVYAHGDWTEEQ